MLSIDDILELKTSLEGDANQRISDYDQALQATHGNFFDRVTSDTWKKWEGVIYDPTWSGDNRKKLNITVNLLNPVIEAKRSLWSVMPQVRCPAKDLSDESFAQAALLERTIRHIWKFSRLGEQLGNGGWYGALLGTCIFGIWPDFEAHRPRIICRSPYGFYGVPANTEQDGTEWKCVLFVTKMKGRQANLMWPGNEFSDGDLVDVIEYWDAEQKVTIVEQGGVEVTPSIPNRLGFVPVVSVPNIAQPGSWWGKSDVIDAIPIMAELNKRFNVENQAFSDMAGAPWVAINPDVAPEELSLDPDAINPVGPGGDLKKAGTNSLPYQMLQSNATLRQYIDSVTDFPEVMRSMFDASIVTGKGVTALMGPLQARLELRQRYLYPRLEVLNRMALKMWEKFWGGSYEPILGTDRGKRFNLEVRVKDFEGYYENEVYLDSSSYFDVQSRAIVGLQMVQNNLLSAKTFVERLNPFVDDPVAEAEQVKKEQFDRIQMALAGQMMAQGPVGQMPDMAAPANENQAMSAGNMGLLEPPPGPPGVNARDLSQGMMEGEGPWGAAEESPMGPAGNELYAVADLVRATPKVRGQVFLSGSILEGEVGAEGVEIWFTDMVDWATVRQFVYKERPDLKGEFTPYEGVPNVPYIEVTPGTSGYQVEQPVEGAGGPFPNMETEMASPEEVGAGQVAAPEGGGMGGLPAFGPLG